MNADLTLTVTDSTTQVSFKSLLFHFHLVQKWMEANGCLHSVNSRTVEYSSTMICEIVNCD